jgi:hypothetical protein
MLSNHKATVGRKIWVWVNTLDGVKDPYQAFDGTVLHVHQDGAVDVLVRSHTGAPTYYELLEVHDPASNATDNHHNITMASPYCTWMPYQKKVMDKEDPQAVVTGTPVVKPAV